MKAFLPSRAFAAAFFTLAMLAGTAAARADDVLVAVAANFADAAQDLAALYEQSSGNKVAITTGSTGKLYAQIKEGAPFQILLSADAKTPAKLEDEQAAVKGSRFTYAIG